MGFHISSQLTPTTRRWEVPNIRGTIFGGPHNEDYSVLGSILGSPLFAGLTASALVRETSPTPSFFPAVSY